MREEFGVERVELVVGGNPAGVGPPMAGVHVKRESEMGPWCGMGW